MNILFTNAEFYSVVNMVRSLWKKGHKVFVASEYPHAIGFYSKYANGCGLYPSSGYKVDINSKLLEQPKKEKKFIDKIKFLVDRWNIDLLFPCFEDTLISISKNRDKIDTRIPLPEHEKVLTVHDKIKFTNFCMKHNISIPRTYFPNSEKDVIKVIEEVGLPLIVKPNIGSGGDLNTYLFRNQKEVLTVYKKLLKLSKRPIIQEYVKGTYYSSIFVLSKKSNILTYFCCETIGLNPKFPISKENHKIIGISERVFKKIGWAGIASPQFIIDENNDPKILEINPRVVGGVMDLAILCDINIPNILCNIPLIEGSYPEPIKDGFVYITPRHFISFLKEVGFRSALNYIRERRIIMDRSFLDDPLPILADYCRSLQRI